jgi:hypothetical protein
METDFPMYLMYNKVTGKTCFILSCAQIGSSLCRLDIGQDGKLWMPFIHRLVSFFMKITDAKYHQKYFTDFTTVDKSVLLNHEEWCLQSHGVASQIRPNIECGNLQSTMPDWW